MKSEEEKAEMWRNHYAKKALSSSDKHYYERKAAEWTHKVRRIRLSVVLS